MNIEVDEDELLNGAPDPSWEYYVLWHRIKRIQAQIDQALIVLSKAEDMDYGIESDTMDSLIPAFDDLKRIITELHPEPEPNPNEPA